MNYKIYKWAVFVCLFVGQDVVSSCGQEPKGIDFGEEGFIASIQQNHHLHLTRRKREATINDRKSCGDLGSAVPPKTRQDFRHLYYVFVLTASCCVVRLTFSCFFRGEYIYRTWKRG